MRHQHMKESDLVKICEKCKRPHGAEFSHEFSGHKHYLCVTCKECGHDMCVLTEHMNSGHSDRVQDLEDGVKENVKFIEAPEEKPNS